MSVHGGDGVTLILSSSETRNRDCGGCISGEVFDLRSGDDEPDLVTASLSLEHVAQPVAC